MNQRQDLERAIAALEAQRSVLGDAVVDASVAALREKLSARETSPITEQQRKQVTIVFADIVGSTRMGEHLDPEAVMDLMDGGLRAFGAAVEQHGGYVARMIGDGLMAIFGVPSAREDDPERSVRAGLAIVEAAREYAKHVAVRWGIRRFAVRVGINTGLVALGEVGGPSGSEYTAMGDAINLAARLQSVAPWDGVLVSDHTYRHVRDAFDARPVEPRKVKGKKEPVQAYVILRARPGSFRMRQRGVEGIETRTIGREAELRQLQHALHAVLEQGKRRMVTVKGDAGVGKSRLLYEFENWIRHLPRPIRCLEARASLVMQRVPYALIRRLVASHFRIQDSDGSAVVRQKLEGGITETLGEGSQMRSHFIGQLLGYDYGDSPHLRGVLDDARQIRDRALIYLAEYFRAMTSERAAVMLLEDIHWADDSSLDLLNQLTLSTPNQRLLIVCTARPLLTERRPAWGEGQAFHSWLQLSPLSEEDSRCLLQEVLRQVRELPEVLRELVVSRAEGNPLYLEESVKILIEDGVIVKGEGPWHVETARLASVRVPATLTGILQARLDSLPREERTILQQASVVGRRFWDSAVVRVAGDEGADEKGIHHALTSLQSKEMIIRRETSSFSGTQEFVFKHSMLRDVTYESVLKRLRRDYHALVAEWLLRQCSERTGEWTGLIAEHLELAGRTEQAAKYLHRAGEQALTRFANAEADAYLSRALDLIPETDHASRYAVLAQRQSVRHVLGQRQAERQDLALLNGLAEVMGDEERRGEVALRQAGHAVVTSDYPASVEASERAIGLARTSQAVRIEAEGHLTWGKALLRMGDYHASRPVLGQALSLARTASSPQVEGSSLNNLGLVCFYLGDYGEARAYYQQALRICRETADRRTESAALNNLGIVSKEQGDYAEASSFYHQALRINREIGDRRAEGLVLGNLGVIHTVLDEYAEARFDFEESLLICREVGHRLCEGNALVNLGKVSFYQGAYTVARDYYEQALRIHDEIGERQAESEGRACSALLLHHLGEHEAALEQCRQALTIAREIGDRATESYALAVLGHVSMGLGQRSEAAAAYREALILRRELGQHGLLMEPLAGLASVSLVQGDLVKAQEQVEEVLGHLAVGSLGGADDPFRVYLTCHDVLRANQDARAQVILQTAHQLLQERAAKIRDERMRRSYLENVPSHREILAEYAKWIGTGDSPGRPPE